MKLKVMQTASARVLLLAIGGALVACGGDAADNRDTASTVTTAAARQLATTVTGSASREMERLGRGVVAVRSSATAVFVSWRLLGLDPAAIAFNVYRSANGAAAVKLNATPLTGGTNYTDSTANLAVTNAYSVRPVIGGVEQAASLPFALTGGHAVEPVVRIALNALPGAGYETKYVWVGDLDGDGEYDYVLDRLQTQTIAGNNDIATGQQYLEAYKRDGTPLWQIDLGPSSTNVYNITPGAATLSVGMYDGVTVYDLNGDGKAEVVLKVANGVKFGNGATFTNADPDQQFIAVLDGLTGVPLATRAFPSTHAQAGKLGTQLGIGYANGVTPSIYFWGRNRNPDKSFNDVFASWSWRGGNTITEDWLLPKPAGQNLQASHQMRIIDLDGDGKDELTTGNFAINSNGTLRYALPGVIHGDRFYITRMTPTSTDLDGYGIQQDNPSGLLEYGYNASSGAITWTHSAPVGSIIDVGRGLVGDIDPRFPGFEAWSFSGVYNWAANTLTEPDTALYPWPAHALWWDADLQTELLNETKLEKWNPLAPAASGSQPRLLTLWKYDAALAYRNPMFIGDILGDWRTEVVLLNPAHTELVIFSTDIPTSTRLYTMPHNPGYRAHMTIKGYLQSPYPDYYLGTGMSVPSAPNIHYVPAT
jgi:hypothetical protein